MMESALVVGAENIAALEVGARLLGSGGAGRTHEVALALRSLLADGERRVPVLDMAEVSEDRTVVAVGLVGSIMAYGEKPTGARPYVQAFEAVCAEAGSTDDSVLVGNYETAGANAFAAALVAATTGSGLVDVDGMGRAFPRLDQTTLHAAGVAMTPCTLVDANGRRVDLRGHSAGEAEDVLRLLMPSAGGWSAFAGYRMSAGTASRAGIKGAIRRALWLGEVAHEAIGRRGRGQEMVTALAELPDVELVIHGRVGDLHWHGEGARRRGSMTVEEDKGRRRVRIEAQNEFLLIMEDGEVIAETPTIIDVIDAATGEPISAEELLPGYAVSVLVLAPPEEWARPEAHGLVSLAAMGYRIGGGT